MQSPAPVQPFRLSGRRLSRFLLVEALLATLLGLWTSAYAFTDTGVEAKATDVGEGMIYLVCAIVLSWGAGLYHYAIDEMATGREIRRGVGSLFVPRPAHIDVPWTGNDIIFGMVGALVALNLVADVVAVALAPLFHLSITSNPTSGPVAADFTIASIVGYVAMVASVLAFSVLRHGAGLADLGWRRPLKSDWYFYTPLIACGVIVVGNIGLLALNKLLIPSQVNTQCAEVRGDFGTYAALALIVTAVAAPIFEETVFRGFLYGFLRGKLGFPGGAVVSGLIFALYHLDLALLLPLWFLGVVLATLYEKSRSLFPGMLVHCLYNIAGTAIILFSKGGC